MQDVLLLVPLIYMSFCVALSGGVSLQSLRNRVNVTLRRFVEGSDPVAARWDFTAQEGQGGWESDGCTILQHDANFTTLSCDLLSNYALLMVSTNSAHILFQNKSFREEIILR